MLTKEWSDFIDRVREFFKGRGYLEVHTPVLLEYPNIDPNVKPISLEIGGKTYYLQTSPEPSMKKLLSILKRDIFQIAKVFRDDPVGKWHRKEFTMLEWYAVGKDYNYLMQEITDLVRYLGYELDWESISVERAFEEYAGIILSEDEEVFKNNLMAYGYEFDDKEDWETLFYRIYIDVERQLGKDKLTFLKDFPKRLCVYAKIRNGYAERFELYIKGVEIANGWTEETDKEEIKRRMELWRGNLPMDEELLRAYEDMPECAGCSIGLERLFSVLKGYDGIVI